MTTGIPGIDIYCRDSRRKVRFMKALSNFFLGVFVFGAVTVVWISLLLYVTWAGDCVKRENQSDKELSSINICLNPKNW